MIGKSFTTLSIRNSRVKPGQVGGNQCLSRYAPVFDKDVQVLLDYPGTQVATTVQVSGLDYAGDIVFLSNNYREMQGLDQSVNHHAAAVGMGIYYS